MSSLTLVHLDQDRLTASAFNKNTTPCPLPENADVLTQTEVIAAVETAAATRSVLKMSAEDKGIVIELFLDKKFQICTAKLIQKRLRR